MKKKYIQPNIHIIAVNPCDIIATSPMGYNLKDGSSVSDAIDDSNIRDYELGW